MKPKTVAEEFGNPPYVFSQEEVHHDEKKPKQPWPNHNWCVGCSPDNCSCCGTEPIERRKPK